MNPLYQSYVNQSRNPAELLQRFQQFRNNFNGNPQQVVQQMLNTGKVSQSQYNQAVQLANQLAKFLKT